MPNMRQICSVLSCPIMSSVPNAPLEILTFDSLFYKNYTKPVGDALKNMSPKNSTRTYDITFWCNFNKTKKTDDKKIN